MAILTSFLWSARRMSLRPCLVPVSSCWTSADTSPTWSARPRFSTRSPAIRFSWAGSAKVGKEGTVRIGILGSGLMGGKLGTLFARAGHEVVFSYARSERKLERLAREAKGKARAGTPREAAREADAVLLAVHWSRMDNVLNQAGDLSGK